MADPKNSKEGEGAQELNQTAREYLLFLDTVPDNADNVTPEVVARANTYAAALELIKDDPQFEPIVTKIREKFSTAMERIGLDPSVSGMSESWTYWDMAKQKHINDHPDEQDPRYRTGDPLADAEIQDQIASRHLGWEIYGNNSRFDEKTPAENPVRVFVEHESLANLDKDHANYPEIMELLKKDAKPENGTLSSIDLAKLGALIRQNLGEEDVSLPNSPSESEETDLPPALEMDSPARPFPPPDTMGGEETGGRKSVLGRMWRGEYVSKEEQTQAALSEKILLKGAKAGDIVTGMFGYKVLYRLADRMAKRGARQEEITRILGVTPEMLEQGDKSTESEKGEENPMAKHIQKRIASVREHLESSKYLSPKKRQKIEEELLRIEERFQRQEETNDSEIDDEIIKILQKNVGERTEKSEQLKDSLGLVTAAGGAYAIRLGATGLISLWQRRQKLEEGKAGDEKLTLKEFVISGVADVIKEMFGQGRLKEINTKEKAIGILKAWGGTALKALVPTAIILAGSSELAEKGGGAFTKALERAQERSGEITEAWSNVDIHKPLSAISALLNTLNTEETFHRITMGVFKGGDGTTPNVAETDTSGADVPDVATEPDTLQYNKDFIGPREEGVPQPTTAEPEVFGPKEASSADSESSGPGPVESNAMYTKANLEH
ncbi:hypothetical protein KKA01_00570, partial [Patescibacteria group bacterium]|nr:hypothetical protein [Patescibacteria group bacterium]